MKIAGMADIHIQNSNVSFFQELFKEISGKADVLSLCGDITEHGLKEEAILLGEALTYCKIPIVGVLGNHDYENDRQEEIKKILSPKSMTILEGQSHIINNIGFAGAKGFGGGFEDHMLGLFGEETIKQFVYEAINESLKLETALSNLKTEKKIVLLHYSPIRQTVIGEPEEIFPFLGSSRLEETIDYFNVNLVLHGHAHYGTIQGKTIKGVDVYNIAMPLLQKVNNGIPYKIFEV